MSDTPDYAWSSFHSSEFSGGVCKESYKIVEILFCHNYSSHNDSGSNLCQTLNIQRIFRIFWIFSTVLIRLDCLIKTRLIFRGSFCTNTLGAIFVILEGLKRRGKVNLKFICWWKIISNNDVLWAFVGNEPVIR